MRAFVQAQRGVTPPFDIVVEGETPGEDPAAAAVLVRPYAEAGATWWLEARWTARSGAGAGAHPPGTTRMAGG